MSGPDFIGVVLFLYGTDFQETSSSVSDEEVFWVHPAAYVLSAEPCSRAAFLRGETEPGRPVSRMLKKGKKSAAKSEEKSMTETQKSDKLKIVC
ncbi:MAG: hypothetical protein SOS94_02405 [Lachnospiraceae bacterium]|nr:hypothetical protein [Bacillota bacterium]MDY2948751.1 hypothetical protein [Lachnospiraceae bacterium]